MVEGRGAGLAGVLAGGGAAGRGGFDCVLGNPPWERVKLQEQEFFAARSPEIANAVNAAARKKMIAALVVENPGLSEAWLSASRRAEGESHFARASGRFPLCGKGDVNTYALFAEHNRQILGSSARAGFIVPSGLATDDTTKFFFQSLMGANSIATLWEFENVGFFSAGKGHMLRFALTTLVGTASRVDATDFLFQGQTLSELSDPERHFTVSVAEIELLNPNTRTAPIFRFRRDADISLALYRRANLLWREGAVDGNPWGLRFSAMFHMASDSKLFRTRAQLELQGQQLVGNRFDGSFGAYLPLVEAKMVNIYNHRSGSYDRVTADDRPHRLPDPTSDELSDPGYVPLPCYWVPEAEVAVQVERFWDRRWLLGWRDVTDSRASIRSVVSFVIPYCGVGHTTPLMFPDAHPSLIVALIANLSSFALDYAARQKIGGLHLTYNYMKQLPVLAPNAYGAATGWNTSTTLTNWLLPRVLELTYTAWDLQPFAQDVGYDGPPFRWDPARRFLLRCELDAAFFHLYGLNRDDTAYIMDTFPIVRKHDEKAHGEYRTKRIILEIYDEMAEATRTGVAYRTRLVPGAASPEVAHCPLDDHK